MAVVGAFYFAFITALNTSLQARPRGAVRGRVMALWMMGFGGTVGMGNLIVGPVVAALGITGVLLFGAGVALPSPGSPTYDLRTSSTGAGQVGVAQALLVELSVLASGSRSLKSTERGHL